MIDAIIITILILIPFRSRIMEGLVVHPGYAYYTIGRLKAEKKQAHIHALGKSGSEKTQGKWREDSVNTFPALEILECRTQGITTERERRMLSGLIFPLFFHESLSG